MGEEEVGMSYQVLARKWRPREFDQMVGQTHVVRALRNALDGERLHHAFLFTGTRGVGKTTVARILAKCLNCERGVGSRPCGECASCRELDEGRFVDLIEVDAASRAKVDETRDLMDNVQFAPTRGRYKVYLIDEVHMFSEKSFNALLKTLEEPPPHVKFLLATTDPQKLPVTVLSRCLQFNLKRLPVKAIVEHLAHILEAEGVPPEAHAVRLIAEAADGSMRDALSLLDQAIAYGDGRLEEGAVRAMLGSLGVEHVHGMLEALAAGDGAGLMERVDAMAAEAADFEEVLGEVLSELQRIALAQTVPEALDEDVPRREGVLALAERMSPEDVQLWYQIGVMGRRDLPFAPNPRGGFEMILLRMLAFRPAGVEGAAPASTPTSKAAAGAAPRPAAAEAAPPPASSAPLPLRADTWVQVVDALGLTGLARELAVNSSLREQRGDVLWLQLAPAHAQLTARNVKDKLQAALSEYCGTPVLLRFDITAPGDETPAGIQRRDADERRRAALAAIETDPNVRAIVERFEASIDEGSIRPGEN